MTHPNDDFIKNFGYKDAVARRFLPQKKDIIENYNQFKKQDNLILNENIMNVANSLFSRTTNKNKNISTNPKDWKPVITRLGVFHYNPKTKQWMNNFGVVADSFEDLIDTIADPALDTTRRSLSQPTSILDYEVWAVSFLSVDSVPDWNTTNYTTFSIVPSILYHGSIYNGLRGPTGTNSQALVNETVSKALTIPESRRVISAYYLWDETTSYSYLKHDYYKNTDDGFTYANGRFLSIWTETQFNDCKNTLIAFLQSLDANNISIPYFMDDKESIDPVYGLQGYNLYWPFTGNSPAQFDGSGNPTSRMQFFWDEGTNVGLTCDARQIAALINDSRFTSVTNPQNNKTVAQSFLDYYKQFTNQPGLTLSAIEVLSKWAGVTHPGDFQGCGNDTTKPYSYFGPGSATTSAERINELYIRAAWDGALHEFVNGYYATRVYTEAFAAVPRFAGSTYSNYENFAVGVTEGYFARDSNDQVTLSPDFTNISGGKPFYGNNGNIIYRSDAALTTRSGYITNPTTDDERYRWCGHNENPYSGPGTLVRYPQTLGPSISDPNFYKKLSHKQFIDDIKWIRHTYRTKPDFWKVHTPFISPKVYYASALDKSKYFYELIYHLCLHGVLYFIYYDEQWLSTSAETINNALNEWHTRSGNSKARPCSNAGGDINTLVDRLIMYEAVENCVKSGGQVLKSGKYLWRITVPPTVRADETILLQRVGSDSDIPEFITIDTTNIVNGYGAWVERTTNTPPNYVVVPE